MLSGILNIDKPTGLTSHDVVDLIRRAARIRKVGHAGTLDPLATGVLPICLGNATKLSEFLMAEEKEYSLVCTLGIVTDSQDITGQILEENPTDSAIHACRMRTRCVVCRRCTVRLSRPCSLRRESLNASSMRPPTIPW